MGEISRALGQAEEVEHKGKKYKLSPLTFEAMGEFELWLEDRAWKALQRQRRHFAPQDFTAKEQALIESIAAGKYSFFSVASTDAMQLMVPPFFGPGLRQLLLIRLRLANPNDDDVKGAAGEKLADEIMDEKTEAIAFLLMKENAPDPNSQCPPTKEGAGGESKPSSPSSPESPSTSPSTSAAA